MLQNNANSARVVIRVATLILLAMPLAADAQQARRVATIGFAEAGSASVNRHCADAFRQRLRELKYVEGRNIHRGTLG